MPLSEQEQRLLDEMERNLYRNEADVVAPRAPRATNARRVVVGCLLAVVGIVVLVLGVSTQLLIVGVGGFALMFVGVLMALTQPVSGHPADAFAGPAGGVAQGGRTGARRGFMDRMNDRWDRRQDERP
ncbi:MAG TPA: DUF3040 domain-containing protein [Candidatus Lumbricidophila sp.]|nr:DUF3040 domain-containing protein [Candidatus Lumbricidophila sp.]